MSNKTYITDDHNLNDSSIAASSKAVKTAYDRASTAIANAATAAANSVTSVTLDSKTLTVTKGDGTSQTYTTVDTDTNNAVAQTVTTTSAEYPILTKVNATATTETKGARFASDVTLNPSKGAVTAKRLVASNAKSEIVMTDTGVTKGTTPTANAYWDLVMVDKTNDPGTANRLGAVTTSYDTSGNVKTVLYAYKPEAGSSTVAMIGAQFNADGTNYGIAPTSPSTHNTTSIATTAWVRDRMNKIADCSTAAATAAKTVTVDGFVLETGARVLVRFTVTNTAASPTLNVSSTGAKAIYYRNAAITAGYLAANRIYEFVYDGSQYELIGDVDTNTTYTAASAAPIVAGTAAVGTSAKYAREDHVHPAQTTVSGNAGSATKLATARTIDGVSFNGSAAITHFGTCSTAAATAAKTVALTGFTLVKGAVVFVQFTVTNTAANPTLNVNSTGAKAIYYRNAAITAGYLAANRVYAFVYDGSQYELIGDINTDGNDKVKQTITTTNAEYALLAMVDAAATATKTNGARFSKSITMNPSTNTITAAKYKFTNGAELWIA